ncbi:palmitoyltransferase pfa4 [Ophiostoma piceae UAMH 11346]|uniref:Palmitoyltransferase PFA4 n=1 Tax=Ophiostoma piceae (strain UAMH 11346) TaxID=1262450 RepID=S3CII4_OPHP1|nr:palmitoyltransferase pfa4 [Ophiostoma piceae UAMH 11346]
MQLIAIPSAVSIIVFLGYSSQYLFNSATYLEPGPLSPPQLVFVNCLLGCIWWTYYRACTVDPGRYDFSHLGTSNELSKWTAESSADHKRRLSSSSSGSSSHLPPAGTAEAGGDEGGPSTTSKRWCKKCNAPKPDRSHHCRHCRRCIPKMDHHCPWTGNCVSMQTFPHFLRFIVIVNVSLWLLAVLLARRFYALYEQRHLPAYLGPTMPQLIHLTVLTLVCSGTLLALSIMLYSAMQTWLFNTTMIEGWEIERHEAVIERYGATSTDGSYWNDDEYDFDDDDYDEGAALARDVDDDDDEYYQKLEKKVRKAAAMRMRIEFPYDLGFFANMAQAMGTSNFVLWLFPFAGHPVIAPGGSGAGWDWPENGFNDHTGMWPPPDPEKLRHAAAGGIDAGTNTAFTSGRDGSGTAEEEKAAFHARQEADFRRRTLQTHQYQSDPTEITGPIGQVGSDDEFEQGMDGEPGWTNADGDRLRDFGVDEDADDDDDVPIATLLKRRGGAQDKKKQ